MIAVEFINYVPNATIFEFVGLILNDLISIASSRKIAIPSYDIYIS